MEKNKLTDAYDRHLKLVKKRQGPKWNDDGGCTAFGYYQMPVLLNDAYDEYITTNGVIYCVVIQDLTNFSK